MFGPSTAIVALSALTLVSGQANSESDFTIDPSTIDLGERLGWCTAQANACNELCYQVSAQSCDEDTLDFTCTCNNDESPDFNQYTDTIPYYVCQAAFQACNLQNVGNARGQENCTTSIADQCGTESAANETVLIGAPDSSSTSSAPAGPSETAGTETSPSASASPSPTGGAVSNHIQLYGNGLAALAAAFLAYML